jgi:drug/metabolite transporter (DMT)-like permease
LLTGNQRVSRPTTSYLTGALCGLLAVSIWASWSAVTRLAVTTRLDAYDIAFLRFAAAGVVLLPFVLRRGLARDRLGWFGLIVLVVTGGVPYVLLAAAGLRFAPAHHQAALNPGFMPLFVALIAAALLREQISVARAIGLALILAGAIIIVFGQGPAWTGMLAIGHALFLAAALLWAIFTVLMRYARLDPLHATALISTGSLITYGPAYLIFTNGDLARLPLADLAIQTVFQAGLVTIVSLVLYGRAIANLGAAGGAAFGALVPGLTALIAIPLLGEWPSVADWIAMVLVSLGVYLASGGPWPHWSTHRSPV